MLEGVHATLRQLDAALERNKVIEINPPPARKFDPHQHQAISVVPAEQEPNTVVDRAAEGLPDRRPRAAPGAGHRRRAEVTTRSTGSRVALETPQLIHNSNDI